MSKTRKSNSSDHAERGSEADRQNILELFKFRKSRRVKNNLLYGNFSNEIIISRSGQAKVANLDSCLNFVSSDFVVF